MPEFDGGSPISSFSIEYDNNSDFSKPGTVSVPLIKEAQTLVAESSNMTVEEQSLEAIVEETKFKLCIQLLMVSMKSKL